MDYHTTCDVCGKRHKTPPSCIGGILICPECAKIIYKYLTLRNSTKGENAK